MTMMKKRWALLTVTLAVGLLAREESLGTELYNLDFTDPEVGTYEVTFGSPSIESSVGPFTDALVFDAVTSYEQIKLPISIAGPRYNIQYDVLVHNLLDSQYAFSLSLDTPEIRNVDFHGGSNSITVFQPFFGETNLGPFVNDQVYHMDISIDFEANLWTVAVDGTQRFSNPINATELGSIRITMAPWISGATDAPGTYAALDNVVVTVVPEPRVVPLASVALIGCLVWRYLHRRRMALP